MKVKKKWNGPFENWLNGRFNVADAKKRKSRNFCFVESQCGHRFRWRNASTDKRRKRIELPVFRAKMKNEKNMWSLTVADALYTWKDSRRQNLIFHWINKSISRQRSAYQQPARYVLLWCNNKFLFQKPKRDESFQLASNLSRISSEVHWRAS